MYEDIQYLVFEYMETNLYQYYKNNNIKYKKFYILCMK